MTAAQPLPAGVGDRQAKIGRLWPAPVPWRLEHDQHGPLLPGPGGQAAGIARPHPAGRAEEQ